MASRHRFVPDSPITHTCWLHGFGASSFELCINNTIGADGTAPEELGSDLIGVAAALRRVVSNQLRLSQLARGILGGLRAQEYHSFLDCCPERGSEPTRTSPGWEYVLLTECHLGVGS